MVKMFTTPPRPYPYVLINVMRPKFSPLRYAEEVIIDSGVEIFRDPNVKDYPRNHIMRLLRVYTRTRQIVHDKPVYVTVPDYPDDYHPRSLWLSEEYTNIERTVENVLKYTEQYKSIPWLIPIQGWNRNPKSVLRTINLYKEHGIIDRFDYFAVANLCVESDVEIMYQTLRLVREVLPDKKLHVFGLRLNALKKVYHLIDSFDSTAWTRPVNRTLNANYSCKTSEERIKFFDTWLERFLEISNNMAKNTSLEAYIYKEKTAL
jgi:hypothetical protein